MISFDAVWMWVIIYLSMEHVRSSAVHPSCPAIDSFSCPIQQPIDGDPIQLVVKRLLDDHPLRSLPEVAEREVALMCTKPACLSNPCNNGGTCSETLDGYECACLATNPGDRCQANVTRDCQDLYDGGIHDSGVYTISPAGGGAISVYCDMQTSGQGWLVFQNRFDGSVDFYKTYAEYQAGFGDLQGEFWLSLDNINVITQQRQYQLRIDFTEINGAVSDALFESFSVADATDYYRMTVGAFVSGLAGDSMSYHNLSTFSTWDYDSSGCAASYHGAWWYAGCYLANLNGQWGVSSTSGITYHRDGASIMYMQAVSMKLRPVDP